MGKKNTVCLLIKFLTSRYQSIVDNRVKIECASNVVDVMEYSLSLLPYKKAAVTSKSITLNFFPADLRVAALEIKLLALDIPGVPENRVPRWMASLTNSRAALYRSLVREDPFGRQHHGLWIEFRRAPIHLFIHAFLRISADLLCFRDLVFRQLRWYLFAYIVRPPMCPTHVPLTVCCRQVGNLVSSASQKMIGTSQH